MLKNVTVLLAEWVPTGCNEMYAMQERCETKGRSLKSLLNRRGADHESGMEALVSGVVDRKVESGSVVELAMSELAAVYPTGNEPGRCCTFEAHVYLPEDEGVLQLERFAMHCHASGDVLFAAKVDAVMAHGESDIPVDLFSRVLLDMQEDSRHILTSLISRRQRTLLDSLDPSSTNSVKRKFSTYAAIMAEGIEPRRSAADYFGADLENELRQILGDLRDSMDLKALPGPSGVLLIGTMGVLLVHEQNKHYEAALVYHAQMSARLQLSENMFHRIFELEDMLDAIRDKIASYRGRSSDLHEIRDNVTSICRQEAWLNSMVELLNNSIDNYSSEAEAADGLTSADGEHSSSAEAQASAELRNHLHTDTMTKKLRSRVKDIKVHLAVFHKDLSSLRDNADVISERQMFRLQENLQNNTRSLEALFRANESSSSSLYILQAVLGGSVAFAMLDRITGEFTVKDTEWGKFFFDAVVLRPFLWFALSMFAFFGVIFGLNVFMNRLVNHAAAVASIRIDLLALVRPAQMKRFLEKLPVSSMDVNAGVDGRHVQTFVWDEPKEEWNGTSVRCELSYDCANRLLLALQVRYNNFGGGGFTEQELTVRILGRLAAAGVFVRNTELEAYLNALIPDSEQLLNGINPLRPAPPTSRLLHVASRAVGWATHVTLGSRDRSPSPSLGASVRPWFGWLFPRHARVSETPKSDSGTPMQASPFPRSISPRNRAGSAPRASRDLPPWARAQNAHQSLIPDLRVSPSMAGSASAGAQYATGVL